MSNTVPESRDEGNDESRTPSSSELTLPPVGEAVLVQFEGFRCMAYLDSNGKWRDCERKSELHGTVRTIIRLH